MSELIDTSEHILSIAVFSEALWGIGGPGLFHAFVVVQTSRWWWSLERMGEGTTVQRSKRYDAVAAKYRRAGRTRAGKVIEDRGRHTMSELVDFLYAQDLVGSDYLLVGNNCKDFAKALFDRFAQTKAW